MLIQADSVNKKTYLCRRNFCLVIKATICPQQCLYMEIIVIFAFTFYLVHLQFVWIAKFVVS